MAKYQARAETDVAASPERVWKALTDPTDVAAYMGGTLITTSWEVSAPITWQGEYEGRAYEDKGEVLVYDRPRVLSVTHYSPLMGQSDARENYHVLVYTLTPTAGGTRLTLSQDGNTSSEQAERFSRTWQQMLDGLKTVVEQ